MKLLKIAGGLLAALLILGGGGLYWMASTLEPNVVLGAQSPEVSLQTHDGEELTLASLRGKVVLLDFWGST